MARLTLLEVSDTEAIVTNRHFGANAVYATNTGTDGVPYSTFSDAVRELGIDHLRYPAGKGDPLDLSKDGETTLDITRLRDGELRPELTAFLDWSQDRGILVTLVIPTRLYSEDDKVDYDHGLIRNFARLVVEKYPESIAAIEIGNEYWNQGEATYSTIAGSAAIALSQGFADAGLAETEQPNILVQMATPNQGSDYHKDAPGMEGIGFRDRLVMANEAIINGLSGEARDAIDGVIEHYYFHRTRADFADDDYEVNHINLDIAVWEELFGQPSEIRITEWNVSTRNLEQNGMASASVLAEMMENMLQMGADGATIWPVQHNTTTDLSGGTSVAPVIDDAGRLVTTIRGAIFDLMESSLVGGKLAEADFAGDMEGLEINAYSTEAGLVFYISSRSLEVENVSLDFGTILDDMDDVSAVRLGIDQSTSDGRHFDSRTRQMVDASSVMVNGSAYYYNEHDVGAEFTDLDPADFLTGDVVTLSLLPYEVVELTFTGTDRPPGREVNGTTRDDDLEGGMGNDVIRGLAGNDTIRGAGGSDMLFGGADDDEIIGDGGNDLLYGGVGDDLLEGRTGNDSLWGGAGTDTLLGGVGADALWGRVGDDILRGGWGDDILRGGWGDDILRGGWGTDSLGGGMGHDIIAGGPGHDRIWGGGGDDTIFGGAGDDLILAGDGADVARGRAGDDSIWGAAGDDSLWGGAGADTLLGGVGADALWGRVGDDILRGGLGDDILRGGWGTDSLGGGIGHDIIAGGPGHDFIWGGAGDDTIFGGAGDDRIYGGNGDDVINGGADDDLLAGGAGRDRFVFSGANSPQTDRITDFDAGEDTLQFTSDVVAVIADLTFSDASDGSGVEIAWGAGHVVIVETDLSAWDLRHMDLFHF